MMINNFVLSLQPKSKFKFRQTSCTQPVLNGSPTCFTNNGNIMEREGGNETQLSCCLRFSADTATEESNSCPFW